MTYKGKAQMNKIMIIEDDKALREELSVLLEKSRYSVQSVKDFKDVYTQMLLANADLFFAGHKSSKGKRRNPFKEIQKKV